MRGNPVVHLSVAIVLLAAIWPAAAGAAAALPLTEEFVSTEGLGFRYPAGWFVEEKEGKVGLTNFEGGLDNPEPAAGQVQIFFFPTREILSTALDLQDGIEGKTPMETIKSLIAEAGIATTANPVVTRINNLSAARTEVAEDDLFIMILAADTGFDDVATVMAGCREDEQTTFRPTVLAVMASLKSTGGAGKDEGKTAGQELRQWATGAQATSQYGDSSHSAQQATGRPNTKDCGDNGSAWASRQSDSKDSLTLTFDEPVFPVELNIHQTYNPGSITGVDLIPTDGGDPIQLPDSADPDTTCPRAFTLTIEPGAPAVQGVVIHLDQSIGGNWNEIDAVELVGRPADAGRVRQWASTAEATSEYGDEDWSARQATGPADVDTCGDSRKAWASESGAGKDTLTVRFDVAVVPEQVNIHQVYNPGSIKRVELLPADGGKSIRLARSADADETCPHVFRLKTPGNLPPVNGVAIYVDQTAIGSWNEIDAVELIGRKP